MILVLSTSQSSSWFMLQFKLNISVNANWDFYSLRHSMALHGTSVRIRSNSFILEVQLW